MFDKYGEFDSAEEINEAVKAQLEQEDLDAILEIAMENGIDKEEAEDFIDGVVPELVTPIMAALGKLEVEAGEMKLYEIMEDWFSYIKIMCQENENMARAVRKKGKSLKGCIAEILNWSFKNQHTIEKEILKAAGVTAGRCTLGIPGMGRAKKIITHYYMGKQE